MAYRPLLYPSFGKGLNLRDQSEVGPDEALDLLDVECTARDAVKQRGGHIKFTAQAAAARYDSLAAYYTMAGTRHLVAGAGNEVRALDTSGALVASQATSAAPHQFARFGSPSTEVLFAANGTDQLRQWNGAAWTTPAWTLTGTPAPAPAPTGRLVSVWGVSNRLVNARRGGSTEGNNPSTCRFSNPGDPVTWDADNFVDLTPGDGEPIMGMVSWRELLFVFKQSKFFIFYGESTDETGNPEFNYRPVSTNVGLVAVDAVATARDGVYFLDRTGVYKTNGNEPELVSNALDALFRQVVPPFYSGSPVNFANIANARMGWHDERLFLAVSTRQPFNDRLFVFDTRYGWWSVYSLPCSALCDFRVADKGDLMFAYATGSNDVGRHRDTDTADAGAVIPSFWQGGWWDHKQPVVHTVREHKLWGLGQVISSLAVDYMTAGTGTLVDFAASSDTWGDGTGPDLWADGTDPTDTWGGGEVLAGQLVRDARRGSVFSLRLAGADGAPWEVHRAQMNLRDIRIPQPVRG